METNLQQKIARVFRYLVCFWAITFAYTQVDAQALTGVKTIPGDYSSLKIAIDSLNANGVGTGGVTFNIAGGYTETLTAGLVVTATGTLSDPIVFQKSGVGADPLITAYVGTLLASSASSVDVMWTFQGSDYVTIDGIDLAESVGNTTPTTMMEVGYGFYKVSGTDGTNNNTIQNCTVTLNRNNITAVLSGPRANATGSVGIEVVNATSSNIGTAVTVTSVAGASSNNKFYGNTIQNVGFGILLSGFAAASPYTLADLNNDIGGNSLLTGNNIINFGGGTGATAQCGAVLINNQWSFNISYNTVNNNTGVGVNHPVTNRGIWLFGSSVGASCDINFNKITISGGASTSTIDWCLDLEMAQSGANGNTININNNQFLNCNKTAASTVAFTAIWINTAATTVNVSNNYIYGFSYSGTGTSQAILSQFACGNLNISNNIIDSVILDGATGSGTHYNIGVTVAPTVAVNINNNTVTKTILTTAGVGSKTLYGIYYTGSTPLTNIIGNTVNNIARNGTTGGTTIGIYQAAGTNGTSTTIIRRNTVSNLSIDGTGTTSTMYGVQVSTGTIVVDSNEIFNLTCIKTTGTGILYGIYDISSPNNENYSYNKVYNITHNGTGITYGMHMNTAVGVRVVSFNTIYNISGGGTVAGISQTNSSPSIFNNRIYNLTTNGSAALIVSGIVISTSSTGTARIYNNLISGLFAPLSNGGTVETVRGINMTSTSATVTYGIYNNTINLNATSAGANFSTTGVFHTYSATATSATLDLRNNIIVNTSTPNGTGKTSAIRRSAATDLNNFSTLSNRNDLYAGTPSASNLIYFDGTNSDSTIANYISRVTPRDTNSVSENPTFLSTTGASAQFLKLDTSIATFTESAARNIAGITRDFANTTRAGNAGYTGLGGAPDMGAWEADNLGQPTNQMVFDSAFAEQQLGLVPVGNPNSPIVRVRVHVANGYNALEATSFKVTSGSTTSMLDVTNAKIYYTGSSATFSTTDLYGTTASPGTSFYINGSKRLALGVNYFWVVYDISNGATPGNFLDAAVDSVVLSGVNQAMLVNDPAGNRQIAPRLNGNYNVGASQTYTSLTAAMNDLNLLGVSGPVTFTLMDAQYDSVATSEIFPIELSPYVGSSTTNTVTILPAAAVASRIVSIGSVPVFRFNGGSNYIIDGRQGATGGFVLGNNLIIENTSPAGNAISFVNDADSNQVLYVDVKGANTIAAGTANAGVIIFGTTTGTVGNDFNIIRHCDIHESTAGFPAVAISSIGSGTSVAVNNINNTIDSNNIYNFFNATVASAGIYIGANNGTWQINNNKFYQTTARTYTTAAITHRVLWITPNTANLTSASGFTITNNYIGGDNASGTGIYDLRGNTTYVFNAMDISVGIGAATVVQGNTVTNISDSTTAAGSNAFAGINIANGNADVLNNLIGSRTVNGAISFYAASTTVGGAMGIRTGGGTNNTINISGNIVSGFSLYGTTATSTPEFFGINVFNGTNINVFNNLIGDTILTNSIHVVSTSTSSTSLQRVSGIFNNPSATAVHNIYNNVIANITNDYAGTSTLHSLTRGIVVSPTVAGTFTTTGNVIKNITTASQTSGTANNVTLMGIIVNSTVGTFNVSSNTIFGLKLTGVSTTASVKNVGIFYSVPSSGTNMLTRNFIHSQSLTAANPQAIITGIDVAAGNGIISNNMIRVGIDDAGLDITTPCTMRGITKNLGNASIYFNTVYIGGSGVTADSLRSFAFQRTGTGTDDVRNNIFVNARTNATTGGGHFAVSLLNNTTLTQEFNLLNGDTIGLYNGTQFDELSSWKVGSGVDATSITSTLAFVNATGNASVVNLHLDSTVATPIEAYGSAVTGAGTDVDFDGQTRSGLTPVDLGADAGNFIPSDIAGPVINYIALVNTISTGDRALTATITDATGVYVSGVLQPRVYFKKFAAGSWNSAAGVLTSGTKTNGTWTFTINATTLGGLIGDDSVYYFVVAQDSTLSNTLGSAPGGVEGTDVNTLTVFPNASTYKILPILNGNFNVGAGQPFTTLTGANGLFNYINAAVIGGNVTVNITSDIEEPGTNGLNTLAETGVGNYTVTIMPDSAVVRNITGSFATASSALIRINGADRVTIDGSFGGSGRYLRFMNRTNAAATINYLNDADFNTIANCIIEGVNNTVGTLNFFTAAVGGTGNDSNTVINCLFKDTLGSAMTIASGLNKPNTGIFSQGTAGAPNDNNSVIGCEFDNFRFNILNINATGGGDYWTVYDNKIYHSNDSNFQNISWFQMSGGGGHLIRKNSIGGSAPDRSGLPHTLRGTGQQNLIWLASTSTIPSTIDSNTIGNVLTSSTASSFYGIRAGNPSIINANIIGGAVNPWDTITLANICYGILSGANGVFITNNTVSNIRGTSASAIVSGIYGSSGSYTIRNNTVRDISSPFTGTFVAASGPIGIYALPAANELDTIDGNSVYNISAIGVGLFAKGIQFGTSSSNVLYCTRNRIYNITVPNNANAAAAGIVYTLSGNNTVAHNQISLGINATKRVFGIFNNGTSPGVLSVFHNSIHITGTSDSTSFGIYNVNTGSVTAANNLIYNNRSDTTGSGDPQCAIGAATVAPIAANLNYNLFVVNDTAAIAQLGLLNRGWSAIGSLYTTSYNTNWAELTSVILSNQLFTDTSVANLSPVVSDPAAWYLNGKAKRIVGFNNGDFTAIRGVRSSTIVGGAVDIGSVEFTPISTPPLAIQIGNIAAGDSASYFFASRLVAKAKWGFLGTLPTALDVKYYSGMNPPNTYAGATFMNAYWDMQATGGSGYDYTLTLMQDSAVLGTVGSLNNLTIARYEGSGTSWMRPITFVNNTTGFMSGDAVNTMGMFTGTDSANNPLPVTLTNFAATAQKGNVIVDWSTASETNNHGFNIERSLDGRSFETVGFVKGAGNSNTRLSYVFNDQSAFAKTAATVLYYRLKQVDMNGKFAYSQIAKVSIDDKELNAVSAYPNPFNDAMQVNFRSANEGLATVRILNIQGMVVSEQSQSVTNGMNRVDLKGLSTLDRGMYFVQLTVNGETTVVKMMKN